MARIKEGSGVPVAESSMMTVIEPASKKINATQDAEQTNLHEMTSSMPVTVRSGSSVPINKRRGYMYNEASGKLERVIRKRKRKTASQLEELALAFDTNPHWTKETLLNIATRTSLTEA